MDTAFLTGGTGFVGASLARLLVEKGLRVRALVRPGSNRRNLAGLPIEFVEGTLSDGAVLESACKGARYAFHLAADYRLWVTDPAPLYAANVDGTARVIEAAAKAGCERIVHCSSVAAVKPPDGRKPSDEASEYSGIGEIIGHYKRSKFLAEQQAMAFARKGLPVVIVNPAAPIGPYDIKPTPTGKIIVDFLNGRIPSYIDTGLNFVDVADAAMGHYLAALKGQVGRRYILGGENLTLKAFLDILADVTGLKGPAFKTPYFMAYLFSAVDTARARLTHGEPLAPFEAVKMARHYMWFDSSRAIQELGYSPRPVRDAAASAVDYFNRNGYAANAEALQNA